MKACTSMWLGAAISLLLVAGPGLAQTQTQQTPPPAPGQPAPAQPAPPAPRPFPEGAKIAFVNIQAVASNSAQGKTFSAKIQELQKKKNEELAEKNKALQAAQQKLQTQASVMNDDARAALEKDIDRMTRELQLLTTNAQAEVQELQPLAELGPQGLYCEPSSCNAIGYGFAQYHILEVEFSDGITRRSNIFETEDFESFYTVHVRADDLYIEPRVNPLAVPGWIGISVACVCVLLIISLAVGLVMFLRRRARA